MSIWISRAAALLALAACVPVTGTGSLPRSAAFIGGSFTAAAPSGYCIDTAASHDAGDGAVVLIGRCADGSAALAALITLSVGGQGSSAALTPGAKALTDYFRSDAGRAALARDGRASSVRVLMATVADGALVLKVDDRNAGQYWRAILGVRGRLVTISVSAPGGGALPEPGGRALLDRAMAQVRAANAGAAG